MTSTPAALCLPAASVLVDDVDEELFLVYTRKIQLASSSNDESTAANTSALGYLEGKDGVVHVALTVKAPAATEAQTSRTGARRRAIKSKSKESQELVVEVEVHQALDALRHRKGDTGSVLWRSSLHLAEYLLQAHHFPSMSNPPLFPSLASSTILELGAGTGFLGLALRSIWGDSGRWVFSDLLDNLLLVVRNLKANDVLPSSSSGSSASSLAGPPGRTASRRPGARPAGASNPRVDVVELDWLVEAAAWDARPGSLFPPSSPSSSIGATAAASPSSPLDHPPDLILAADCVYNPCLSAPFAKTLLRHAGPDTVVLVACELRDQEPIDEFLRAWVTLGERDGWRVARLGWSEEKGDGARDEVEGIKRGEFAVWVGWRVSDDEDAT
ncbi:hypothetical protein JCM3775_005977 [Rhodotorula graminis]|uniref:Uncharacterized protein n=1 Tax=Rhodotorula graminis (strain WP1) TaxID=578459 RepID=A0A194SCR6_RHOGW|nr:uncharacterized protein RHOBADRAFT_50855 [Rhodotorula graminis WP1]KPV78382.1 hypothetical protein RHOBADRAFT_50855 [Rhodotorula graminis WP1]